jgi:hypothetical protein
MDKKRKICVIFQPGREHLFLDISSTNFDTLVPSLYQRIETSGTEVFSLLFSAISAPPFKLRHQRNVFHQGGFLADQTDGQIFPTVNIKYFFTNILCIDCFAHKKIAQQNAGVW